MPNFSQRVSSFVKLGQFLKTFDGKTNVANIENYELEKLENLNKIVQDSFRYNGWFVEANVRQMLVALGNSLENTKLQK